MFGNKLREARINKGMTLDEVADTYNKKYDGKGDISPKDAQYLLGHSQLSTTMDIYTDIRLQREKEVSDKIKSIDIRV